jgi:hypothetical protein
MRLASDKLSIEISSLFLVEREGREGRGREKKSISEGK